MRWRRKIGQAAKVGSTFLKDRLYDWEAEAVLGCFKAKVALEALKGKLTLSQLATKHGVHQTMIAVALQAGWGGQSD